MSHGLTVRDLSGSHALSVSEKSISTETASGSVATFETDLEREIPSLVVAIEPIQSGSGDPSPDNVRPISGFSAVNVWRTGKNLLPTLSSTTRAGISFTVNADGSILINGTATAAAIVYFANNGTAANSLLDSGTYTLSRFNAGIIGESYLQITTRMKDTGDIFRRHRITPSRLLQTFTISDSEYVSDIFIRLSAGAVATNAIIYPQLELGSTATDYEPYQGNTYSVNWQTEAGTVYGGTLDVISGKLRVTRKRAALDERWNWSRSSMYPGGFYIDVRGSLGYKANTPFICSHAKTVDILSAYVDGTCFCDKSINFRLMPMDGSANVQDWKDFITAQKDAGTPIEICYELATPLEYTLDPVTISTLLGQNNIWADVGDITVTYQQLIDSIAHRLNVREVGA